MDDLPRVHDLISVLTAPPGLGIPVTAKIRIFDERAPFARTVAYARMLQDAGCAMLAVHGRTRDQRDCNAHRANWAAIAAVRAAVDIPVLANGDIRSVDEAEACMAATGCAGVLSAEPLLWAPDLFSDTPRDSRPFEWPALLALEYCALARQYDTPPRIVFSHAHKLLGRWLADREFRDLRPCLSANSIEPDQTLDIVEAVGAAMRDRLRAMAAAGCARQPEADREWTMAARGARRTAEGQGRRSEI
jgi:tRNA-dihydrouridine synthase 1